MALSTATITFDISDLLGVDFNPTRTRVWASTNVPSETIVDTVGNQIRLGTGTATLNADGTGSLTVWVPGTGSNPGSWQTTIHVDHADRNAPGGRAVQSYGPFTITASGDLADLIAEMPIPPEYNNEVLSRLAALESGGGVDGGAVPPGGTTAQVLAKNSGTDYDTEWVDAASGGGGGAVDSVNGETGVVTLSASDVGADLAGSAATAQAAAIQRANHTGTQAQSTVTNLVTDLAGKAASTHTHVATTDLTATGTKDSTTFLRGDNTWATPAGGGGGAWAGPPLFSGAYVTQGGAASTGIVGQGNLVLTPLAGIVGMTVDQVAHEVPANAASAFVRMGVYTRTGRLTFTRDLTIGVVDCSTSGFKTVATSFTVAANQYLGYLFEGANSSIYSMAAPGYPITMASLAGVGTNTTGGFLAGGQTTGSMPASLTVGADDSTKAARYYLRKA